MTVIYLFGKFSDQDMDWIIGAGTRENVAEGRVLITEGKSAKSFYITLSGRGKPCNRRKPVVNDERGMHDARKNNATKLSME